MESRPSTSSSPIEAYKTIAKNMSEKISHRLVVDGGKVKSKGLWGRFVMFLSELGRPSKCKTRNNDVMDHFERAINDSYSDNTLTKILENVASLKQKLQNENRSLRARDVRNLLQSTEQQEPERQISHQAQITDSDDVVPSFRGENFKSNDPIAQLSQEIKKIMTSEQLNVFKEIMSDPSTETFRNENDLSMDEFCALVLATHFEDTAEQVQAATGANAENSKYSALTPLLDSALTKLPSITEPVYIPANLKNPSATSNQFIDILNQEKTIKTIWADKIFSKDDPFQADILNDGILVKDFAIITLHSDQGKLLHLGNSDDLGPTNFVIFKPGSRRTVQNATIFKINDENLIKEAEQEYNRTHDEDDKPIYDRDNNMIGACLVDIAVN